MLVMTRREGATVYGGKSLTADIEQTYDHAIRVERIVDNFGKRVAEISVRDRDGGYSVYTLTPKDNEFRIGNDLRVVMIGLHSMPVRDGGIAPTLRLGFDAPLSYKLIRDDAIRRTR